MSPSVVVPAAGLIISELEALSARAQEGFGNFSAEQLNWKPCAEVWSYGQCFDHLIKSNELYFDHFDQIAKGTQQNSFCENYSPLSGFYGKFIANALKKDAQRTKTISRAVPPSEIEPEIIERFITHQTGGDGKDKADGKCRLEKKQILVAVFKDCDT